MKVVLLGAGLMIESLILAVLAATGLAAIRGDEAKGYLDNLLVRPVNRRSWLSGRLAQVVGMVLIVALLSAVATWIVAGAQDVHYGLGLALANTVALLSAVWVLLAIGVILYGLWPRLAAAAVYVILVWSFMTDILKAIAPDAAEALGKSSFLHYVPTNLTKAPDWPTVGWLAVVGLVVMIVGVTRFNRRDIISE
jgi:ABC-2 type transport system permease protein